MISGVGAAQSRAASDTSGASGSGSSTSKKTGSGIDSLANESTFLKLLVAQIKNQNPLNPTDGVQFLTQLAQFSSLEQNLQIKDTLSSIQSLLDSRLPAATTGSETGN